MSEVAALDFAALMAKVAPLLCGERNKALTRDERWRFGTHGSMEIDASEGWFADHESKAKGGVLELIQHKRGCDLHGALTWLEDQGLKEKNERRETEPVFYDYVDADGKIAYRVERRGKGKFPPFLQHGPDGRGGFHSAKGCMQGVPRLPYRLPDVIAADPEWPVFIVEGEKDADRLAGLGFVATTNSGGAGKFTDVLAPHFARRRVVIIPDNDQAGWDHAQGVLDTLKDVASAIAILTLPVGAKGDVSDWLSQGGSALELTHKAEAALKATDAELLDLDDAADWERIDVPPRRWLVEGWLPIGEAALLTGAGSVGKSLVSQQLAATIAAGCDFMGVRTDQAVTLYVTCEDGKEESQRRHKAILARLGKSIPRGRCMVKSWKGELDLELATFDAERRLRPTARYQQLRATALAIGARFIVLDNTSHLFGGDENVKREVAAFANLLNGLVAEIDGVVLLLGHPNKTGLNKPGEGDANQFGGSVAWENQVRSRLFMASIPEHADARELTNPKANYAGKGGRLLFGWYQGAFVRDQDLPNDARDQLSATIAANADNDTFLRCLAERTRQRRSVSEKTGRNLAPVVFAAMPESNRVGKARLEAAMDRLFRIGRIERAELWKGPDRKPVFGLREVRETPAGNGAETLCGNAGNHSAETQDTHTTSTTYYSGGAPEVGTPDEDIIWEDGR